MAESPKVREWLEREDGRAETTKRGQLRQLERFLRKLGMSEGELLKAARDPERIRKIADGFVRSERKAGRRPAYALAVWYGVKSFLSSAGVPVPYSPVLTSRDTEPVDLGSRRVPTPEELRRLVDSVSLRNRAIVLFIASSGVRIGVIATEVGSDGRSDGLRLENLPDLDLTKGTFAAKPALVLVPPRLSKNGKAYVTFLSTEAATVLEGCLDQRLRSGEKFELKTPVFVPDPRGVDREARTAEGFRTLNHNGLSTSVSEWFAAVAPKGVSWTAHTLRAWCSSRLESAESQGLISRTRREFFLGHSLGVDGTYNLSRPLSADAREELRKSYARVESFLSVIAPSKEDSRSELVRSLATAIEQATGGKTDGSLRGEDLVRALRDALGAGAVPKPAEAVAVPVAAVDPPKRPNEERSIGADLVGRYLESGWSFRSPLNSHLAVVRWDGPFPP
jgi:integrase